jgi:hypothetical protein
LLTNTHHIESSSDIRKSFFVYTPYDIKAFQSILEGIFYFTKKPERDGGLFYAGNNSIYSQYTG